MALVRIAILHYSCPPLIGGVEATIGEHARLLADHGYSVRIVAGRGEPCDVRVPVELVPLLDSKHPLVLEAGRALGHGSVPDNFEALTGELAHDLEQRLGDTDICIVHNALTLHKNLVLTAALARLAAGGRPRLIGWCHDFAWDDPVYVSELHPGEPWNLLRQKWGGVRYVVVSEPRRAELARLLNIPAADIAVVPPGIDLRAFLGIGSQVAQWADALDLWQAAPLLLLPARVTRRKNIELAIDITAALTEQGMAPRLVVMGPLGPHNPSNASYLDALRRQRAERGVEREVIFLNEYGPVDEAARRDLYLLADALLFTSQSEGFGIPVLEAALVRLPIFCSDIPAFRATAGSDADYFQLDEPASEIAARVARRLEEDARYRLKRRVLGEFRWESIFADRIAPLLESAQDPH